MIQKMQFCLKMRKIPTKNGPKVSNFARFNAEKGYFPYKFGQNDPIFEVFEPIFEVNFT